MPQRALAVNSLIPAATHWGPVLTDVNNEWSECSHCGVNCKCLTRRGQWTKDKRARRYSRSNGGRKAARHLGDPDSGSDSFQSQLFCDTSPNTRHVILAADNYTEPYLHKDTHHASRNFPFMSPNLAYQEKTSCAHLMQFYTPGTWFRCFRSSLCPSYLHFILYTDTSRGPDIHVRRSSGS